MLELKVCHLQFGPHSLALIVLGLRHVALFGEGFGKLIPFGRDAPQLVREPPDRKRQEYRGDRLQKSRRRQLQQSIGKDRHRRRSANRHQLGEGCLPRVALPFELPLATLGAVGLAHRLFDLRHRKAKDHIGGGCKGALICSARVADVSLPVALRHEPNLIAAVPLENGRRGRRFDNAQVGLDELCREPRHDRKGPLNPQWFAKQDHGARNAPRAAVEKEVRIAGEDPAILVYKESKLVRVVVRLVEEVILRHVVARVVDRSVEHLDQPIDGFGLRCLDRFGAFLLA